MTVLGPKAGRPPSMPARRGALPGLAGSPDISTLPTGSCTVESALSGRLKGCSP
jgi:hypothetical protein